MNSTHLLAWITCLVIAFFACIMSVRNAGNILSVRNSAQATRKDLNAMQESDMEKMVKEATQVGESLDNIVEEIRKLRNAMDTAGTPEKMEGKMQKLQREIKQLKARVSQMQAGDE